MGKKLAIKGHSIRGNEVIALLQMMGGKNIHNLYGNNSFEYYVSGHAILNDRLSIIEDDDFVIFNLEEFLEKYPFKVGDKVVDCYGNPVTIKSMKWSDGFETMVYDFEETYDVLCAEDIESVNDNHTKPSKMKNVLAELLEHIKTTPKEELEREFEEIEEWSNVGPTVEEFRTFCECVNKKPKYPKTFKECRAILNYMEGNMTGYKASLFASLQDLLICRDAYWKIAGEEMGLDKSWEPDWNDESQKYCIRMDRNKIVNCSSSFNNRILAFPTEEMRDIFYENFKDLIESCKELL